MIVCLCNDVRESDIKKMVEHGARTVRDVQSQSLAGTACGACLIALKNCLIKQAACLENSANAEVFDADNNSQSDKHDQSA